MDLVTLGILVAIGVLLIAWRTGNLIRLFLGGLDLIIIIIALWAVMLSVAPGQGLWYAFTIDGSLIAWVVIITYIILVIIAEFLVVIGGMVSDIWYARLARGLITAMIVYLGFPWAIKRIFFFFGLTVASNVEDIMFYTAFIRFIVRFVLGRRFVKRE